MDRKPDFPPIDFEGMTLEIWQSLGAAFYHSAYVRIYADTLAMRVTGSKRREAIVESLSQADRDQLQEDVIVFRAHYAAVLWQLCHLCELVRKAYGLCSDDGIMTAARCDILVKTINDDPIVQEIKDYRNMSHQRAGVVTAFHDTATDTFIAHVFPPLRPQSPVQHAEIPLDGSELEWELNKKLQEYIEHVSGYCEGLFQIVDEKYKRVVLPRNRGFSITVPNSYEGQAPKGANGIVYVDVRPIGPT